MKLYTPSPPPPPSLPRPTLTSKPLITPLIWSVTHPPGLFGTCNSEATWCVTIIIVTIVIINIITIIVTHLPWRLVRCAESPLEIFPEGRVEAVLLPVVAHKQHSQAHQLWACAHAFDLSYFCCFASFAIRFELQRVRVANYRLPSVDCVELHVQGGGSGFQWHVVQTHMPAAAVFTPKPEVAYPAYRR